MSFEHFCSGQWCFSKRRKSSIRYDDPCNIWKYDGFRNFALKYNQILQAVVQKTALPPVLNSYKIEIIKGVADTIAPQQKEIFDSVYANVSVLRAVLEERGPEDSRSRL